MSTPIPQEQPTAAVMPDLTALILAQLTPIAQQAGQSAVADLQTALEGLQQDLAQVQLDVSANRVAIERQMARAGSAVLADLESDPVTQRIVVCSIIGVALAAAFVILVGWIAGNSQCERIVAAAPALLAGTVLWVSKVGVPLPKPITKGVPS